MIPSNTHSGVLPPFLPGVGPVSPGAMSPYRVSFLEVAHHFGTSPGRIEILQGLLAYRKRLGDVGISQGFQWIDGSFVEDCEKLRGRPPGDVDIITFSSRPITHQDESSWKSLIIGNPELFDPEISKQVFKCDAYFVDLTVHPILLINHTKYWFGLFSHQRDSFLWKGMIEVPLTQDDSDVELLLTQGVRHAA